MIDFCWDCSKGKKGLKKLIVLFPVTVFTLQEGEGGGNDQKAQYISLHMF